MTRFRLLVFCALAALHAMLPGTGAAQAVVPAPYDELARALTGRVDFETMPRRAEPGIVLDAPLRAGRVVLGERFAGQRRDTAADSFDRIAGRPAAPLAIRPGPPRRNLSVALHRGFGSTALFPLGPRGFPLRAARGEGAVALLFDDGQAALGLRVHSDYPDPLGSRPGRRGTLRIAFYDRQGRIIARHAARLETGVTALGFRRADRRADIAGIVITNDDPGGIAIDDILYQTSPAVG